MEIDWNFIKEHSGENPDRLRLRFLGKKDISGSEREILSDSILQIDCRRKYEKKFPGLAVRFPDFLFPSSLAAEQASHLWVAELHAAMALRLKEGSGFFESAPYSFIDLTTGLGLDFMCISRSLTNRGNGSLAIELDEMKAEVLRMNLEAVGLPEAIVKCGDSIRVMEALPSDSAFLIFADPARRGDGNSRIYNPQDCLPDVTGHWEELLSKSQWMMVKNSPLLDLHKALEFFPGAFRLIVISVRNECKEVLVIARKDGIFEGIECVNIENLAEDGRFGAETLFIKADEWNVDNKHVTSASSFDLKEGYYLYEPNSSVMKAFPWHALASRYPSLLKLSPNSHLFLSSDLIPDFPGRVQRILSIPDKTERKTLRGLRFNVVTRNYPLTPDELTKKLKIKTGGDRYLYGATISSSETPVLIITERMDTRSNVGS